MTTNFFQKGKLYEVITDSFSSSHVFPKGAIVECTEVVPVGSDESYSSRLMGTFEGLVTSAGRQVLLDQDLQTKDVKVYKETK